MGGALIPLILAVAPVASSSAVLSVAMIASVGALVVARRLNQWYLRTLESGAVSGGKAFDELKRADESLRQQLVAARRRRAGHLRLVDTSAATATDPRLSTESRAETPSVDPELQDALALRARDPHRAMEILTAEGGLSGALVHHVIPLLAVERLAEHAMFALCQVAEEHVGELGDALLDPARRPVIRHRLARVLAACISQRAADVLVLALEDSRFDIRFQAARSLAAIRDKNPRVAIDRKRIHHLVVEEVSAVRPVWDSQRESLPHVLTLLSFLMPREPLRMVERGLQSGDEQLRAEALGYLESVLPPDIGRRLLPLLAGTRGRRSSLLPQQRAAPRSVRL